MPHNLRFAAPVQRHSLITWLLIWNWREGQWTPLQHWSQMAIICSFYKLNSGRLTKRATTLRLIEPIEINHCINYSPFWAVSLAAARRCRRRFTEAGAGLPTSTGVLSSASSGGSAGLTAAGTNCWPMNSRNLSTMLMYSRTSLAIWGSGGSPTSPRTRRYSQIGITLASRGAANSIRSSAVAHSNA